MFLDKSYFCTKLKIIQEYRVFFFRHDGQRLLQDTYKETILLQ